MLTKGSKKLATNSYLIFSTLHFSPLFPTTGNLVPYFILLFIFITSIGNKSFLNSQFQPENCSNRQELAFFITLQNSYFYGIIKSFRLAYSTTLINKLLFPYSPRLNTSSLLAHLSTYNIDLSSFLFLPSLD